MEEHHDERKPKAPDQVHDDASSALSLCGDQNALAGVHDIRKRTNYAKRGSWKCGSSSNHEFDLDIAEALTDVAAFEVVGRPYEEIDEAQEVVQHDPCYETGSGCVAVTNVPDQGWKVNDDCQGGCDCQSDASWYQCAGSRKWT